jgi:hypothetical protein
VFGNNLKAGRNTFCDNKAELGSWNKFLPQAPNAVLVKMGPVATPFGSNRSSKEFIPKNALA